MVAAACGRAGARAASYLSGRPPGAAACAGDVVAAPQPGGGPQPAGEPELAGLSDRSRSLLVPAGRHPGSRTRGHGPKQRARNKERLRNLRGFQREERREQRQQAACLRSLSRHRWDFFIGDIASEMS